MDEGAVSNSNSKYAIEGDSDLASGLDGPKVAPDTDLSVQSSDYVAVNGIPFENVEREDLG